MNPEKLESVGTAWVRTSDGNDGLLMVTMNNQLMGPTDMMELALWALKQAREMRAAGVRV